MGEPKQSVCIQIDNSELFLKIFQETSNSLFEISREEALANGEAPFQILEGRSYEYEISKKNYELHCNIDGIVSVSHRDSSCGRITPKIYVGTLTLELSLIGKEEIIYKIQLEVLSTKLDSSIDKSYRENYRYMLKDITEQCTELLLQHNSPVSQYFEVNYNAGAGTLYQRFVFMQAVINSDEFNHAVQKVISAPVTIWKQKEEFTDIRNIKKAGSSVMRQLTSSNQRFRLPEEHSLSGQFKSVPVKIQTSRKTETVDTPENRFIKHVLNTFLSVCNAIKLKAGKDKRLFEEAAVIENNLAQFLSHPVFKEISTLTILPLNSPVLQRKEGYREILRAWLMFDLASKLIWRGGDDIYSANKKDIATLYEYWLFFKLLDIIKKDVLKIDNILTANLIELTADGLDLKLKQGKYLPIKGVYDAGVRKLNFEFSYNKTFSVKYNENDSLYGYKKGGSWTRPLRPDYTLSIWPYLQDLSVEESQEIAEREEMIVHIHFDAKYRIDNFQNLFDDSVNLDEEKEEQRGGNYKRADLLKMHTYKDAIRRTAGAYVIYPGSGKFIRKGFHEIIPGLGAFSIRPGGTETETKELTKFLKEVLAHFLNRASQREIISLKNYQVYSHSESPKLEVNLPETYGSNRLIIPDETYILIGYYKDSKHLNWINQTKLYNTRAGVKRGSIKLGQKEANANFILLHSKDELITNKLLRVRDAGPKILSRLTLERLGYTRDHKKADDYYIVYKTDPAVPAEFNSMSWDIRKLKGYKPNRDSAIPFAVTLTELMEAVVKE